MTGSTDARSPMQRVPAWARQLGAWIGIALFIGAVYFALRQGEAIEQGLRSAAQGPWWLVICAFVLPLANWTLTAWMYWALMDRPQGSGPRIGLGEMHAVLGSAWLLNYLPARPGMFGRLAYHTLVNRVSLTFAVKSSFLAIAAGGVAVFALLIMCVAAGALKSGSVGVAILLSVPLVSGGAYFLPRSHARTFTLACAVRYLDVLAWLARYASVFSLLGHDLSLGQAAALTAVSQAATLVPFVGNGLGVREWAIGLTGEWLPAWVKGSTELSRGVGVSGDVLNRAAEVLCAIPVGLICTWWVGARIRATKNSGPVGNQPPPPGETASS